ncbi:alpha/beta hydrolase [Microbacterium sp. GXF7504]
MTGLLRRGRWWAEDYVYAGFRQVAATLDRTDAAALRSGTGSPVVLLPGVYESWRFLAPLARWLHAQGHPVHVVEPLRHNRRPVTDSARHVADVLQARDLTGVTIVAHSKGGLIGKEVMLGTAGGRIRNMVAIATPFGGSRYAAYLRGPSLRIFSPRDPTIVRLALETAVNTRITSVAATFDPHIPEGSSLVDARNVLVPTGGHFRILARPEVRHEILRALAAS